MVRLLVAALAVPLLAAGEPSPAHPDFSGKWVLDLRASRLHPEYFRGLTRGVVRIAHRDPEFSFRRAFTRAGESTTVAFTLSTDGRATAATEDGMPTRRTLRWDGEELVFVTVYRAPRGEARNTVRYALRDGGRTLVAAESFRGPRVSYDNVWVFSKARS